MASGIELVVQGDDFGMCHAVNTGVAEAFTNGILSQASTMVACPWFDEAAALAAEHDIPLGVHLTLTCEWDYLRWPPLTGGPSLAGPDRHGRVDLLQRGQGCESTGGEGKQHGRCPFSSPRRPGQRPAGGVPAFAASSLRDES